MPSMFTHDCLEAHGPLDGHDWPCDLGKDPGGGGGGQRQSEGKAAELVGFDLPYESC